MPLDTTPFTMTADEFVQEVKLKVSLNYKGRGKKYVINSDLVNTSVSLKQL